MTINDYNKFLKILRKNLASGLRDLEIKLNFTLNEDLLINSILFYSLLVDIEEAFSIEFKKVSMDDDEYKTVGDLVQYITYIQEENTNGN